MQSQAGFKSVTLAFIVEANGCTAGWGGLGGTLPTDNFPNGTTVQSQVQALQSAGVQVIISFGGASGSEPAVGCPSATDLQALYQSVITRYGVKMLDFDIEGSEETNTTANATRVTALKPSRPPTRAWSSPIPCPFFPRVSIAMALPSSTASSPAGSPSTSSTSWPWTTAPAFPRVEWAPPPWTRPRTSTAN